MTTASATGREIHQLKEKITFLKTYEGCRRIVRHTPSMRSFAENLGISVDTLNDCIKPQRLWLSDRNESIIAQKCKFETSWGEWHDPSDKRKRNQRSYEWPRKDSFSEFKKKYMEIHPPAYANDVTSDKALIFESNKKCKTISFSVDDQSYELNLTSLALANMDVYEVIVSDFQSLLTHQVRTHKSLLLYDYPSVACPLPGGMTAILSKQGNKITLEWMSMPQKTAALDSSWDKLCKTYLLASRLKYRSDHSLLLHRRSRQEAVEVLTELVQIAHSYVMASVRFDANTIDHEILDRKQGAEGSVVEVERCADNFEADGVAPKLGELAIYLDMTLSNVHKLIVAASERLKLGRQ